MDTPPIPSNLPETKDGARAPLPDINIIIAKIADLKYESEFQQLQIEENTNDIKDVYKYLTDSENNFNDRIDELNSDILDIYDHVTRPDPNKNDDKLAAIFTNILNNVSSINKSFHNFFEIEKRKEYTKEEMAQEQQPEKPTLTGKPQKEKSDGKGFVDILKSIFFNPAVISAFAGLAYALLPKETQEKISSFFKGFSEGIGEGFGKLSTTMKLVVGGLIGYFGGKFIKKIADAITDVLSLITKFRKLGKIGKVAVLGAAVGGALLAKEAFASDNEEEETKQEPVGADTNNVNEQDAEEEKEDKKSQEKDRLDEEEVKETTQETAEMITNKESNITTETLKEARTEEKEQQPKSQSKSIGGTAPEPKAESKATANGKKQASSDMPAAPEPKAESKMPAVNISSAVSASSFEQAQKPTAAATASQNKSTSKLEISEEPSKALIERVKASEGFSAKAHKDFKQYSIGYGTKAKSENEEISKEEAEKRLSEELAKRKKYVINYGKEKGYDWNNNQIEALASFVYNLGNGALDTVTGGGKRTNEEIAKAIPQYNKAGGKELKGLVKRRNEELAQFTDTTGSIVTSSSGQAVTSSSGAPVTSGEGGVEGFDWKKFSAPAGAPPSEPPGAVSDKKPTTSDLSSAVKVADSGVDLGGLDKGVKIRLASLGSEYQQKTGKKIQINSGYRDPAKQAELYAKYGSPRAAKPGKSWHEKGLAFDMNSSDANQAIQLGLFDKYGFKRPVMPAEPWHIEAIETRSGPSFADNPLQPGVPAAVVDKSGKPSVAGTGKDMSPSVLKQDSKSSSSEGNSIVASNITSDQASFDMNRAGSSKMESGETIKKTSELNEASARPTRPNQPTVINNTNNGSLKAEGPSQDPKPQIPSPIANRGALSSMTKYSSNYI